MYQLFIYTAFVIEQHGNLTRVGVMKKNKNATVRIDSSFP